MFIRRVIHRLIPRFILKKIARIIAYYNYISDYYKYYSKRDSRFSVFLKDRFPCLRDNLLTANYDSHYVYHTSWAARILADESPNLHTDISSCLRFISITSAFIPVRFYDYRPPNLSLKNLQIAHENIMSLSFPNNSIESLSCMHVLEHIGLGRYGDDIDPEGDIKGAKELERVLSFGGRLLFVVPVSDRPRINFNAHRVYSYNMVLDLFPGLKLERFDLIPDDARSRGILYNSSSEAIQDQHYACGCFVFRKVCPS